MKTQVFYMQKALDQAKRAYERDEVPIGAVVVDSSGDIIARAYNQSEMKKCQTAHAELLAIQKATKKKNDWRLDDCILYVTLEPCLMCLGLISISRIKEVYYGAPSPVYGYTLYNNECAPLVSRSNDASKHRSAYKKQIKIVGSLKEQESAAILKKFFVGERLKRRK